VTRIGEILLRMNAVGEDDLALALADQRIAGKRTCSLLIVRGALEPDQAARALAEQFGVAAALTKHLENRDRSLAKLLPPHLARQHFALPIGKLRDGEIVICVRDPKPELQGAFERIVQKPVLITVAAAHTLEPLIDMTYAAAVTQDFGVRFNRPSTQPATVMRSDPPPPPPSPAFAVGTTSPATGGGVVAEEFDVDMESGAMSMPDEFSLVSLDDDGVKKDFSQVSTQQIPTVLPPGAGGQPRQSTLPPPNTTRTPAKKP
jgi:hypothetical protein